MSIPTQSEIECWNCGEENTVIYGGVEPSTVVTCDNCNEVIGESDIDSLTIVENKEQAESIKETHEMFSTLGRIRRWFGWR